MNSVVGYDGSDRVLRVSSQAELGVSLQEARYKEQQLELTNGSLRRQLLQTTEEKEEREKEAVSWFNALGVSRLCVCIYIYINITVLM